MRLIHKVKMVNAKIAKVESKSPINTGAYGNQTIQAKVTYIDGSEQDVTIPLNVKDVTDPTISNARRK